MIKPRDTNSSKNIMQNSIRLSHVDSVALSPIQGPPPSDDGDKATSSLDPFR